MDELHSIQGALLYTSGSRRSDYLFRVSLKAVIFNMQGEVLVVKEHGRDWWDLPGGGMDHGETIKESLARELKEEVQLRGDFSCRPILIEDPKLLSEHNFYQIRAIYVVHPEELLFEVGEDGDELSFVNPILFKDAEKSAERSIFKYATLAMEQ